MITANLQKSIINYLCNYGVKRIRVFGSRARGTNKEESDLDLLVEFSRSLSLIKLIKIERELSEQIGIHVDLLTEGAISPLLKDKVNSEAVTIFE
ncbi:MAG: hypothetical protein EPN85_07505 [Bacteroidetes bacterium]|nr:MAG: hypothetical protein EPN85_07505 [Bacteroidota bacterium]